MAPFSDSVRDQYNRPVLGATVGIYTPAGVAAALYTASGGAVANPMLVDALGNYAFYADDAKYRREIRLGSLLLEASDIIVGSPPEFVGATGPADNTYTSLTALLASDKTRLKANLVGDTDVPPSPDGQFYVSNGQWVQQEATGILYRGRPVQSKLDDVVSVKDAQFAGGAKGDGTSDDTAAINAAFDGAIDAGVTLYFPAGNYRITSPIAKHLKAIGYNTGGRQFNILGAGRANSFITYEGPAAQIALSLTGNPNSFDLFKIEGIGFRRPDGGYPALPSKAGEALRLTTMNMVQLRDILTFRSGLGIHMVGCLNVFINGYSSSYDRNGIFAERGVGTDPNFPVNPNANQISLRDFNFVQTSEVAFHLKDGTGLTLGTGAFESIGREPAAAGTPGSPIGLYLEDCGLDGPHVLSGNSSVYVEANLGLDVLIKQRAIDANYDFRGWNFNRAGGKNDRTVNAIRFDASTLPAGACRVTINVDGVHFNKYGPYAPSVETPAVEFRLGGGSGQRFDGVTFSDLNTSYPDVIERPAYLDDAGNVIVMAPVSHPTEVFVQAFILADGTFAFPPRGIRSISKVGTGTLELTLIKGVTGLVDNVTSKTPGVSAVSYIVDGKLRIECRGPDGTTQMDGVVSLSGSYA